MKADDGYWKLLFAIISNGNNLGTRRWILDYRRSFTLDAPWPRTI